MRRSFAFINACSRSSNPFSCFFKNAALEIEFSQASVCWSMQWKAFLSHCYSQHAISKAFFSDLELLNGLQAAVHSVPGVRLCQGVKCSERRFTFGFGSFLFPGQGRTGTLCTFPPIGTYAPIWIHLPICCHRPASDADSAGLKPHSALVHQHPEQRLCAI